MSELLKSVPPEVAEKLSSGVTVKIAIKAYNEQYVGADSGKGNILIANRGKRGDHETFRFISLEGDNLFALEAYNREYVTVESGDELNPNRGWIKNWETFEIVPSAFTPNKYAIKAKKNGKYVSADTSKEGRLLANRDVASDWEMFLIDWNP
jgi:hypothetical protein